MQFPLDELPSPVLVQLRLSGERAVDGKSRESLWDIYSWLSNLGALPLSLSLSCTRTTIDAAVT